MTLAFVIFCIVVAIGCIIYGIKHSEDDNV